MIEQAVRKKIIIMKNIDFRFILVCILIIIMILLLKTCDKVKALQRDIKVSKHNITALTDSIRVSKDKLQRIQYEKTILVASSNELKKLNEKLYNELKNHKNKIVYITEILSSIDIPVNNVPDTNTNQTIGNPCDSIGGSYVVEWDSYQKYDEYNSRHISTKTTALIRNGIVYESITEKMIDNVQFNIITGIQEKDGNYEIFVKSDFPGFQPTKIDGAFIPRERFIPKEQILVQKKKKSFSVGIGPQIGIGLNGINNWKPFYYVGIGASIQYTIFKF